VHLASLPTKVAKMQKVHCQTLDELSIAIEAAGPDALYRGQTDNYTRSDGSPSLTTSFSRHGCVPDLMLRWYHYARQALRRYVRGWNGSFDMATDQAILQHYGWISFFLDATGDPHVGAWFASHQFTLDELGDLVEDCFEDPVLLFSKAASFKPVDSIGHLYVISRKSLRASGIGAVHLSEIATTEGSPRYVRQDAYMVGPIDQNGLAVDHVAYYITAPSSVLAAFADSLTTEFLFPEPTEDPIFKELLAMPWEKVGDLGPGIDAFRRSLALPEYKSHVTKHMPANSAMYRRFWLIDVPRDPADTARLNHVLCGSALYHGTSELQLSLPRISQLLSDSDGLIVESDVLIYHGMGTTYGKGVMVRKKDDGIIQISEFGVEHPGLQIRGTGVFPGIHYRIEADGTWQRVVQPEDCDCGTDAHEEHVRLLGRVEDGMEHGYIIMSEPGIYLQQGVTRASDPAVLCSVSEQ